MAQKNHDMINRILIRVKVVQMLYAYLLTRSEFRIAQAPETASPDKKYAYALYVDFLLLMLELSGYPVKKDSKSKFIDVDKKLAATKMAKALSQDDEVKSLILKGNNHIEEMDGVAQRIHDTIVRSTVFQDYKKTKSPELKDDVRMWTAVMSTIIAKDSELDTILRKNPAYSSVGKTLAIAMINDTLANYNDKNVSLFSAKKDLNRSLVKAYDLYLTILRLIVDLTEYQRERLETAKTKFLATHEDINPNTRFIDNALAARLASDAKLAEATAETDIRWNDDPILMKELLNLVIESEIYKNYMEAASSSFTDDCDFWREILKNVILPSDTLAEALENKSIFWNDDLSTMGTFALKTIKQISTDEDGSKNITLLPRYKDEEDEEFGPELFMLGVKNYDLYRSYIDKFISADWDSERLAFMDIVIMVTAIGELINFPAIPLAVTMNEYVEIANSYSTQRSGQFVNGILFSVANYLRSEGIITKQASEQKL